MPFDSYCCSFDLKSVAMSEASLLTISLRELEPEMPESLFRSDFDFDLLFLLLRLRFDSRVYNSALKSFIEVGLLLHTLIVSKFVMCSMMSGDIYSDFLFFASINFLMLSRTWYPSVSLPNLASR